MFIAYLGWGLLGLIIGSFLNVCIYRLPRGLSIVFPRSGCTHCKKPIRPYDNIPVFSYLLLGGKCRFCRKPISFQYPFVELLTGLAFLACALNPDWQLKSTFVNSLFLALIIILIFIDYQHQILPNAITIPGTIVGILLSRFQYPSLYDETLARILSSFLGAPIYLIGSILGAIVGGGLLYLVGVAYLRFRKVQGLGMGDVKMMAMVGAFLGWQPTLITLFAGSVFGLLFGISLMIKKKATLQTPIPFGVFLGIGAAFSLFFGLLLLQKYLALFK